MTSYRKAVKKRSSLDPVDKRMTGRSIASVTDSSIFWAKFREGNRG